MIRTMRTILATGSLAALMIISGCAGLGLGREEPTVSVQSFRAVPGQGASLPTFEIDLVVLNPDPEPLRLEGVAYSIELDGKPLLDGVSNELPRVQGYGQATVTLNAAVNVLGGIRLLNSLLGEGRDDIEYAFKARLDPEGFARDIRVTESGSLDVSSLRR
jgi:LEA14-like dessication related protein